MNFYINSYKRKKNPHFKIPHKKILIYKTRNNQNEKKKYLIF